MKKYFLIVICAVLLFGVVGCSKKQKLVCTKTTTEDELTLVEESIYEFDKDNKITSAVGTMEFNDKDVTKSYCEFFKDTLGDKASGILSCTDTKLTINDLDKLAEAVKETTRFVGEDKDSIIKIHTDDGYTCK